MSSLDDLESFLPLKHREPDTGPGREVEGITSYHVVRSTPIGFSVTREIEVKSQFPTPESDPACTGGIKCSEESTFNGSDLRTFHTDSPVP